MYRPPPRFMNNIQQRYPQYNQQWSPNFRPQPVQRHNLSNNNFRPALSQCNEEHWCDTCDRGFPTLDILNKHKAQHQKCNIDGCQFIAHPNVITKHIQMQHSSGLYKKIAKLSNPEEIQKWRDERKKKYPTKCNIEKKAAERKEKVERGEKMGLNYNRHSERSVVLNNSNDGVNKRQRFVDENDSKHNLKRQKTEMNGRYTKNKKKPPPKKIPKSIPPVEEKRKLKPFGGIQDIIIESDEVKEESIPQNSELIEDDFIDDSNVNKKEIIDEPAVCGALSLLMNDYGSSDEESSEESEFISKTKNDQNVTTNQNNITKINNSIQNLPDSAKLKLESKADHVNENKVICDTSNTDHNKLSGNVEDKDLPKEVNIVDNLNVSNNEVSEPKVTNIIPPTVDTHSDDDSGPEEVKVIKKDIEEQNPPKQDKSNNTHGNKILKCVVNNNKVGRKLNQHVNRYRKPKLPSTLLTKLLSNEMRQERNIILQCIRYIRKNNYFDKTSQ